MVHKFITSHMHTGGVAEVEWERENERERHRQKTRRVR